MHENARLYHRRRETRLSPLMAWLSPTTATQPEEAGYGWLLGGMVGVATKFGRLSTLLIAFAGPSSLNVELRLCKATAAENVGGYRIARLLPKDSRLSLCCPILPLWRSVPQNRILQCPGRGTLQRGTPKTRGGVPRLDTSLMDHTQPIITITCPLPLR